MQSLRAEKGRTGFFSAHERASGKILTPAEKRENCGKKPCRGLRPEKTGPGKKKIVKKLFVVKKFNRVIFINNNFSAFS